MTPALLDDLVRAAASEVVVARGLDPAALPADPGVRSDPTRGEYTTTVALRAAAGVGVAPRELAGWLADALAQRSEVAAVDVAGPGFVNLRMTAAGRAGIVAAALTDDVDGTAVAAEARRRDTALPADDEHARYALLRTGRSDGTVTRRVPENPLFRVQYAHARLVALARNAADLGVSPRPGPVDAPADVVLVARLAGFPAAVRTGEPQALARHLDALADAVLDVAPTVLPRGDDAVTDLHRARMAMLAAARRVLTTGLGLLGVSAPERI